MGFFDDANEEITLDDMFEEPIIENKEEDQSVKAEKFISKEEFEQTHQELTNLKQKLAQMESQKMIPSEGQPAKKSFKTEIQEYLQNSNYDMAGAIEFAAQKAFFAGEESIKAKHIPLAAQSARHIISDFVSETPMTLSVRKEFDSIVGTATDADLANMDPKTLKTVMDDAWSLAEGRVAKKTKNSRGEEPPMYSTGGQGSFGSSHKSKPMKLTKEQEAAAMLAKEAGLSKEQTMKLLGIEDNG